MGLIFTRVCDVIGKNDSAQIDLAHCGKAQTGCWTESSCSTEKWVWR